MTNNHISDEILQAFLSEETQDEKVASHLSTCVICREKLENYRELFANIQKITPETFDFDVTTLVMDTIIQYETQKSKKQELVSWGYMVLLLVAISSFAIPYIPQIMSIFNAIPNFTALLMAGTGFMVALFLLIDLYKQYQLKEKKIFENNLQPIL